MFSDHRQLVEIAVAAEDGDAELASVQARGWHVVSYVEGRGVAPARIRARRGPRP
jgi:hypothetical protein